MTKIFNKYYSVLILLMILLYYFLVRNSPGGNNDSIKVIQLIVERIHLLPNSSVQWTGEFFVSLVSYPLMFIGVIFPEFISLLTYYFLDNTYELIDLLRIVEGLMIFGIYFLIKSEDFKKSFLLITFIYFISGYLLELNLSVISSYFFLLYLSSKDSKYFGISCANKFLNFFFIFPIFFSNKNIFSTFNRNQFLIFLLIFSPTILLHPIFFLKGFIGDIYAKIFLFPSSGKKIELIIIGLITVSFIFIRIKKEISIKRNILLFSSLTLYVFNAQYFHYLFPVIVWSIYLNINHILKSSSVLILCIVFYTYNYSGFYNSFYKNKEDISYDIGRKRLEDNFKNQSPVINKYPFKKSKYIEKLLSDEHDNSMWILNNYPKNDSQF
ncbi:hypothetical protein N9D50_03840 [Flavobacteriaceae bacterium]|nr:hypothetical protein [Flavobacteriaceae bacterium]